MSRVAGKGTRTALWVTLAVVVVPAVVNNVYQGRELGRVSAPLERRGEDGRPGPGGHRMVELQLAPTAASAQHILDDWNCARQPTPCVPVTEVAQAALARDTQYIISYVLLGVLLIVWGSVAAGVTWRSTATFVLTVALLLMVAAAGAFDLAENWFLARALGDAAHLPFQWVVTQRPTPFQSVLEETSSHAHAFAFARVAAMSKWSLILVGGLGALVFVFGGIRRLFRSAKLEATGEVAGPQTFQELINAETAGLFAKFTDRVPDRPECKTHVSADEGYVTFRQADVVGLALSGGGIRSATFNLGLLEGLQRLHILRLVDYLSTVSGGGYVGGFWSAWLKNNPPPDPRGDDQLFPTGEATGSRPQRVLDTDQERHLREFSAFLVPRGGFFEIESWTAVVAFLAGLLPALAIGLSVLGVSLISWLVLTFPLASHSQAAGSVTIVAVTAAVLVVFERAWRNLKRESAGVPYTTDAATQRALKRGRSWYVAFALLSVAGVALLQYHIGAFYGHPWPIWRSQTLSEATPSTETRYLTESSRASGDRVKVETTVKDPLAADQTTVSSGWVPATVESGVARWWEVTGIAHARKDLWQSSPRLFDYGLVWLAVALLMLFIRVTTAVKKWRAPTLAAFDRVVMRLLGTGVIWIGAAALWHVSINLDRIWAMATAAVVSAGGFAALRDWFSTALQKPASPGLLERLKPLVPQVLAYVTVALATAVIGAQLIKFGGIDWFSWWLSTALMGSLLLLGLFLQPGEFGLHKFYRERVSRAYSGACNLAPGQTAVDNRGTEPRDGDDVELRTLVNRPLHLVCCAANDLTGDQVETLGRGARSAVLSKHGFFLGQHARPWTGQDKDTTLGAAVTASAAAFNSNMGQLSTKLGPAVAFLMTTLNLRLGLWVRHPCADQAGPRRWPGILLYREMFAQTSSSGRTTDGAVSTPMRDVHLSDGGHFENLALYELVRRHCRYIIVSDCGADPEVAFDDLGNALRRVREDFGIDVSLDVSSLRPGADGLSKQHVAVGTIHYSPVDKGILLYVKPSLTGDEPPDVQQYRTRNTEFPHEGTGDQFYDEAQWESYRRLGLHAADAIFAFARQADPQLQNVTADWVFAQASHVWGATPDGLEEQVLKMTERFNDLEEDLREQQSQGLLQDVFLELRYVPPADGQAGDAGTARAAELAFILRVTQAMEDVWLACRLDEWWSHPLNLGWINLFSRWATSEAFRFWWPVLSPMFSPDFRCFVQDRFPMRAQTMAAADPMQGLVDAIDHPFDPPHERKLAAVWWQDRSTQPFQVPDPPAGVATRSYYQNTLTLPRSGGPVHIQAGLACVTLDAVLNTRAGWSSDHFFVPPSLWGASIGWNFLKGLLATLKASGRTTCHVVVKAPPAGQRHKVARDDRQAFMDQYRKIGFREIRPVDPNPADAAWYSALGYVAAEDTLFEREL